MASQIKGKKYDPDDLTPRGNLPDRSVIPSGKGMGDDIDADIIKLPHKPKKPTKYEPGKGMGDDIDADIIKLPHKPKKPTKYEPGKKSRTEPKEGTDQILFRSGGSLPDLTGDGKITRADVLKGRGVFKKGGMVKSSASRRADGIAQRGKTKGRFV